MTAAGAPRGVALLGATGSIGRSTLDVLRSHAGAFRLTGAASARRAADLAAIVAEFGPPLVGLAEASCVTDELRAACARAGSELVTGEEASVAIASDPAASIVLAGIVGAAGLRATAAAIGRGARVALANKESLVVAGEALTAAAAASGAEILPVDSEHAALHQCLRAGRASEARRLILTASGGPFRERDPATLREATVAEALRHPTWSMGAKITIDSATLMNKGLEVVEARWLFGVAPRSIEVVIHPQSIVHSLVEFCDGNVVAQLNRPDMRDPIRYCLTYPERWAVASTPFALEAASPLTFEAPDPRRFPCLGLARQALDEGGGAPAVLNAANEVAVDLFLAGRASFLDIPRLVEAALADAGALPAATLEEALAADAAGREAARRAAGRRATA